MWRNRRPCAHRPTRGDVISAQWARLAHISHGWTYVVLRGTPTARGNLPRVAFIPASSRCHRCGDPLPDSLSTTCTPCRLKLLDAILRLRDRLAREIAAGGY